MARLSNNVKATLQEQAFKDPGFIGFPEGRIKYFFQWLHITIQNSAFVSELTVHTNAGGSYPNVKMTVFHHVALFPRPSWCVEGSAGPISARGCEEGSWFLHIPTLQQPWSCLPYYQKGPDLCSHQAALLRYRIYRISKGRWIVVIM